MIAATALEHGLTVATRNISDFEPTGVAAIDQFGNLDFDTRTRAARTARRATPEIAVPALTQAVTKHADGYVRFRALVLLSGFNDPRTREVMARVLPDPNDRLRAVAYTYFEHHPDPAVLPKLIEALSREESEFVRPALTLVAQPVAALGTTAARLLLDRLERPAGSSPGGPRQVLLAPTLVVRQST